MIKLLLGFAALSGFASVAMGAFGAHGLRKTLTPSLMSAFETGVQYQAIHTLAIIGCCILALHYERGAWFLYSSQAFVVGIVLFSGSLYGLALTNLKWLGPVTPLGGVFFLLGWVFLLVAVLKHIQE